MDISTIAATAIAVLSPYLTKAGEEIAKKSSDVAWKKAGELHQAIKARFKKEKDDFPARTLAQFEENPEKRIGAMTDVLKDKVAPHVWKDPAAARAACAEARQAQKVLYIDASRIIASHGDIRNPDVGRLVWSMIGCGAAGG